MNKTIKNQANKNNNNMPEEYGVEIYSSSVTFNHSKVWLCGSIEEPSAYNNLMQELLTAQDGDVIELWINSPGGNLHTALQIVEGIKASPAKVIAILAGECHSGASMIALACNDIVVLDPAIMLVHTASEGYSGKNHEMISFSDFLPHWINDIVQDTYEGFMTPDEIFDLTKGVDFWFNSSQIVERLEYRNAYFEAKEKEEKEMQEDATEDQEIPELINIEHLVDLNLDMDSN